LREIARQRCAGGVDCGLHILRSSIDEATKREAQGDLADAEGACGGHILKSCGLSELTLKRGCDQRCHGR